METYFITHQICTQAHLIYKNQGFRESDALFWGFINIGMKKMETREEKEERICNPDHELKTQMRNLASTEHKTLGIKRQT
nr:hypothetical protein BCU13_00180 [Vibrio lentus]